MNKDLQSILDLIQQSQHLNGEEKKAIAKSLKGADKELEIVNFKLDRTEKVKKTTAILLEETIAELESKRKAVEAQNHELEIEAALERVRSRSIGMQNSNELGEVVHLLDDEIAGLKIKIDNASIITDFADLEKGLNNWLAVKGKTYLEKFHIPKYGSEHLIEKNFLNAVTEGVDFYTEKHSKEEKNKYLEGLYAYSDFNKIPKERQQVTLDAPGWIRAVVVSKNSILIFQRYWLEKFTEEENNIFRRFGKVFEQVYTRFLDLQKAETQAREAQIEAALEKVRSRSLAMHKSDELKEAGELLWHELGKLGIESLSSGYVLMDKEEKIGWIYAPNPATGKIATPLGCLHTETKEMLKVLSYWKKQEPLSIVEMNEQETIAHQTFIAERALQPDGTISHWITAKQLIALSPKTLFLHNFNFKQGYLMIVGGNRLTDIQVELMLRFTRVFQQTYTRFLDLQKAEAQAKEAQTQLALERVRAKTMAMQKSDELQETTLVLFQQFKSLGATTEQVSICVFDEDAKMGEMFVTLNGEQIDRSFQMELDKEVFVMKKAKKVFLEGQKNFSQTVKGKQLQDYNQWRNLLIGKKGWDESEAVRGQSWYVNAVFFSRGMMGISSDAPPSEETIKLLERFANVFDLTFTRFLDLQKAEAQAREAQIEVALERVRARAMAMHKSEELKEVANELRKQLGLLGQEELETTAIHLYDESGDYFESWAALLPPNAQGEVILTKSHFPKRGVKIIEEMMDCYAQHKQDYVLVNDNAKAQEFRDMLRHYAPIVFDVVSTSMNGLAAGEKKAYWSLADFAGGSLIMTTMIEPGENSRLLLRRFSNVFGLAYRRFADLKKAEGQAREAQIQLALERIRASTMAMHKSEELADVAEVLFQQLTELCGNHDRIAIDILDEKEGVFNSWLTDQTGVHFDNSISHKITEPHLYSKIYKAWKEKQSLVFIDLSGSELRDWLHYIRNVKKIAVNDEKFHDRRVCYSAVFSHGAISAAGVSPDDETAQILERFASVFNLTYRRFLDIQRAEAQAREAHIEAALERVRSKAMAMQNSADLNALINYLFEECTRLDFVLDRCIVIIVDPQTLDTTWILSNPETPGEPSGHLVKYHEYPEYLSYVEAWKGRTEKWLYILEGEDKREWDKFLFYETELSKLPVPVKEGMQAFTSIRLNASFSNFGSITLSSIEPITEQQWDILTRFTKVFDLTYTRFNDLKQAEAQARESQIQLALERVRARTMAMQKSDELTDVAGLLFYQLTDLGIKTWTTGFNVWSEDNNTYEDYITSPKGGFIQPYLVDTSKASVLKEISDARKRGDEFFVQYAEGERLKETYIQLAAFGDEKQYDKMLEDGVQFPSHQYDHFVFGAKASLMFITYEAVPAAHNIFVRLGNVFEQTYTRFLDLQKAEAQAREAEIELSLERIRSRAMAMHSSGDILATTTTAFEELQKLGIHSIRCGIGLLSKNSMEARVYASTTDSNGVFQTLVGIRDMSDHPSLTRQYQSWLKQENFVEALHDEELKSYYDKLFFQSSATAIPKNFDKKQYGYYFSFADGVFYSWSDQPYSENEINILTRFNAIVALTFRRFLDLQKAEAQAREAQIEAALERVRSRTMAMQHSDELGEVALALFQQVKELGIKAWAAGFNIWLEGNESYIDWMIGPTGEFMQPYAVDLNSHPLFKQISEARKRGEDFQVFDLTGKGLAETYELLSSFVNKKEFEKFVESGFQIPTRQINHYVFGAQVSLLFITYEPCPDAHDVFKRFGKVFEQTYTRFLDLEKAEAQAREAQIEAALERVRSRTMGMQRSEELKEASQLLFQQVQTFSEDQWACGYNIWEPDGETCVAWMSRQGTLQPPFKTNFSTDPCFRRFYDAKQRGEIFYVEEIGGDEIKAHYKRLLSLPEFRSEPKEFFDEFIAPEFQIFHIIHFAQGYLMFITYEPVPQLWDIFKRFGKVFEQTYTRFLDLQKAEGQALEATKRASVDRVRAEIASMRTTKDLERITPLVWNELTTLGVPFIRCGVFIMDEGRQQMETHLSTPAGKAIATFNLPFDAPGETAEIVKHWRRKELYKQHWNEAQFIEFTQNLVQQGAITSGEKYLTENRPTDLYLHFLPFLQGMLYAGNTSPLSDDELQLMQDLADAFSTAYARYEDFNKLEAAKKQVDSTLNELQSTQKQLIQSEKMASLGELTAGIAHEIQNPLNFVNNFSEVNKELLLELNEEIEKGNYEEVKIIAADIAGNEEKIIHHGKRADSIVRGMLQHSRSTSTTKEPTDINALADEYLRLAYHGLRAKDKSFNATMKTDFDETIGKINIIPQDIGRVILNIITNAFYAVNEKAAGFKLQASRSTNGQTAYDPQVIVQTKRVADKIEITVEDNGKGIPTNIVDKIFQPFFTTKPTGQGTGLGLSLAYDIVKAHGGDIKVETKEGDHTAFTIVLPV